MATKNEKWMARFMKNDNAVRADYNPFAHVLRFSSPGVNFCFGNTQGLPRGYPLVVWGPPKSGKTILFYDMVGQLHRDDPNAWAVRYDTEFKEEGQLTPLKKRSYGIDPTRYVCNMTDDPEGIFDHIVNEIPAMVQDGCPIHVISIDSASLIKGRRAKTQGTVTTQQRGDKAATIQEGLQMIWPIMHKYRIALYLACHARAEQDPAEQMRGKQIRMDAAWMVKHFGGYQMLVQAIQGAKGRETLAGEKLEDDGMKDATGKAEQVAHRVRVTLEGNSFGPKNRKAEFTFDDINGGLINRHEEVFQLGTERGLIERPNQVNYVLADFPKAGEKMTWKGKDNFLLALRDSEDLRNAIITRLRTQDVDLMENGTKSKFWSAKETEDRQQIDKDVDFSQVEV